MRIIAGEYRSRKLLSPPEGSITRPIPDRVKESLFGLLRGNIEGSSVLDAFAGSGAIGLEALSRGAARCVFVERDRRVAEVLRANIERLGCGDRSEVVVGDALGLSVVSRSPRPVDLVFFDPPYEMVNSVAGWERVKGQFERLVGLLSDGGFGVVRTPWPFRHREDGGETRGEIEDARGGRGRRGGKHSGKFGRRGDEEEEEIELSREEWGALAAGGVDAGEGGDVDGVDDQTGAAPADVPGVVYVPGDLKVAGAVGPETHAYRSTAVHLYMRERAAAAGA